MNIFRTVGYTLYAIGIDGGAEGVIKASIGISAVSLIIILAGAALLGMKQATD